MEQKDSRFAVLIDADNVSPKYIKYILDEVSDQGVATYKRIYGDWTDISKKSWKEQLLRYSINPIQQYSNTNGKNSTDSAMIIDAMDILYSGNVRASAWSPRIPTLRSWHSGCANLECSCSVWVSRRLHRRSVWRVMPLKFLR